MRTFSPRQTDFLGHLIQGIRRYREEDPDPPPAFRGLSGLAPSLFPPTIIAQGSAPFIQGNFPRITFASLRRGELLNEAAFGAPGLHGLVDSAGGLALRLAGAGVGWYAAGFTRHGERTGTQVIGAAIGYLLGAGLSKLTGGE